MSALTDLFTNIANAIRAKKGTSASIVASDFPAEIASIEDSTKWETSPIIPAGQTATGSSAVSWGLKKFPPTTIDNSIYLLSFVGLFRGLKKLTDISDVTLSFSTGAYSLEQAFNQCEAISGAEIHNFFTRNQIKPSSLSNAFSSTKFTSIDLTNLDVSNCTSFSYLFQNNTNLNSVDLSTWRFEAATDMSGMFQKTGPLSLSLTGSGNYTYSVGFANICRESALTSATFKDFYISAPTTAFYNSTSITSITFDNCTFANTGSSSSITGICNGCTSLQTIDFGSSTTLALSYTASLNNAFNNCTNLRTITGTLNLSSLTQFVNVFANCSSLEDVTFTGSYGSSFPSTYIAHNNNVKIDLSTCTSLTHTSLLSLINSLYDLATAGKNTQDIVLGATNLAKLSQAEQDMITNKGWTLT